MKYYGSDKPDLRFAMKFVDLMDIMKGHGFSVFDNAAYVGGICAEGAATYTRKQLDALTVFVKKPQIDVYKRQTFGSSDNPDFSFALF